MRGDGIVHGHHLFLTPANGALKEALTRTIRTLSTKYGGPIFEPHLTIAAEIEAPVAEIETFAQELAQMPIPKIIFNGVKTGDSFFKCCYLSVEPSSELSELNRRSRERFSITDTFDPHVSLAYGRYAPEILRAMTQTAENILTGVLSPTAFPYLELWKTEGEVKDWKQIARYAFTVAD